jgi:hypothetical protein
MSNLYGRSARTGFLSHLPPVGGIQKVPLDEQ